MPDLQLPTHKQMVLQQLAQLLHDNAGNRLTGALINGLVNTLHDMWPAELQPPAQPAEPDSPRTERKP